MAKRDSAARMRHRNIFRRQALPCHICGKPIDYALPWMDPGEFVVDHVIPLAEGGEDSLANKRPAHRSCNAAKGAKLVPDVVRRSGSLS